MKPLGGRFVLVREIGSGGMSTVFLGRDEILDRPVAVKILEPGLEDSNVSARFRREGRTAAKLSHPNIVRVYDAGEDELDGREASYIVMEYVSGGDLKSLVDRRGPVPGTMLSRVGADAAAALAHAHERGIIHRDVKPQNILIDEYGSSKLTDFGIARALDADHSTSTSSYLGTAAYSSPEQLRGEKITPKSDVYSLGMTLYHAAVGETPFSGGPIEVANQQITKAPVPPRARGASIGGRLEALILDCIAKDPADRPDAAHLHERFLQLSAASGGAASADAIKAVRADGTAGVSRVVGPAKEAGFPSVDAIRWRLNRRGRPELDGPPEFTISVPTRTFRAGSRQRTTLAGLVASLILLALVGAGAWALLNADDGEQTSRPIQRVIAPSRSAAEPPAAAATQPTQDATSVPGSPGAGEAAGPTPPPAEAEKAVFDMYREEAFQRAETSFAYLSERLQSEVGSPEQWAEQEDLYTFAYIYFTQLPQATVSGGTAEVTFEVRLEHTWGSQLLSGTWVCVVEGGEWKLDRLENETTTPL
jgi:tRNA A-37 threonylcarbamoyl transferase component Bud32